MDHRKTPNAVRLVVCHLTIVLSITPVISAADFTDSLLPFFEAH